VHGERPVRVIPVPRRECASDVAKVWPVDQCVNERSAAPTRAADSGPDPIDGDAAGSGQAPRGFIGGQVRQFMEDTRHQHPLRAPSSAQRI
jgi:hypothetical protein